MLRRLHHNEDMPDGVRSIFIFRGKYIKQLRRKLLQLCTLDHFSELSHDLYFTEDLDTRVLVLFKVGNELDGDFLTRCMVDRAHNLSKTTFAEFGLDAITIFNGSHPHFRELKFLDNKELVGLELFRYLRFIGWHTLLGLWWSSSVAARLCSIGSLLMVYLIHLFKTLHDYFLRL